MRNRTKIATLAVLGVLVLTVIVAVQPVFACGCTPGFWKQEHHFWAWPEGYAPGDTLAYHGFAANQSDELIEALWYRPRGDAEKILLKAGVAALLNTADGEVDYECLGAEGEIDIEDGDTDRVIFVVNAALASGHRGTMIGLAEALDFCNNLPECPY